MSSTVTQFSTITPSELLKTAHILADKAGEILRSHYRNGLAVSRKADSSPVTQADQQVEETLRAAIEAFFPSHGIVGEEFGHVRADAEYQWVIDPIDGTRSFIAGYPLFTTLIAVTYQHIPILGIIDQPILQERWAGLQGSKVFYTHQGKSVIGPQKRADAMLPDSVIATTSIDYFTEKENDLFQSLRKQCANTLLGGDAYAYAMLANGQIDIVIDAGLKPYDFCALKPVIEGAGGVITDWQGKALTLHSDGRVLACANAALHKAVLALLN